MPAKILFVNPPLRLTERYQELKGAGSLAPPLGLLYLAARARQDGYAVELLDACALNLSLPETICSILKKKPDILGLTSTYLSHRYALAIANEIRARQGGMPIIMGGPQVSAIPREIIARAPAVSAFVLQEGEETLSELLAALAANRPLAHISGIGYLQDGKPCITPCRPMRENLDKLPPPAFDLIPDFSLYEPSGDFLHRFPFGTIITSRGCPLKCSFCDKTVFGDRWRGHSAGYVFAMMKTLYYRHGIKDIGIWDDNFLVSRQRVVELCELLRRENMDLTFSCQASVNFAAPELMPLLKRAGCWCIGWGIESGSPLILQRCGKAVNLDQARAAIRITRAAGIRNCGYFIFGSPGETRATITASLAFIKSLGLDAIQAHPLTPLPGTKFYDDAEKFGRFTRAWGTSGLIAVSYVPDGLTAADIEQAITRAYRLVFFNPRVFLRYLRQLLDVTQPRKVKKLMQSGLALLLYLIKRKAPAPGSGRKPLLPPDDPA